MTLLQLPTEVLIHIFKLLDPLDLRSLMLTCKVLKDIVISENAIWRQYFYTDLVIEERYRDPSSYTLCRISHNWRNGIYRDKIILQHHTNYMPWIEFTSEQLLVATGSDLRCYPTDRKGQPLCGGHNVLWNLRVPQVERLNDIRTHDISRFIIKNDIIACGNRDGSVAIYKTSNSKRPLLMHHLKNCHEDGRVEVSAVEVINKQHSPCVISASSLSPTIQYWCMTRDEEYFNKDSISSIKLSRQSNIAIGYGAKSLAISSDERHLAVGLNGSNEPIILDVETGAPLYAPDAAASRARSVRDVRWLGASCVYYVTHSGTLRGVDARAGAVVYKAADPFQSPLYCLRTDGARAAVAGAAEYCRCVLFDLRVQRRHVQMYFTQKKSSPIYSLDFDASRLIAAADRSVCALNFNVSTAHARRRDYSETFEVVS